MNAVRLGIRENLPQFSLLVLVNAFVGAMVGMERSILPPIAEHDFHLAAKTAVLSFIVVFGVTKAITNYLAGRLSDRFGRKHVLVGGWLLAAPVPFLLMWAPSWSWVLFANALLGVSQGLTWSTTVIMKIDLAGPEKRGLAMGFNEFAGYFAVAGSALATGFVAAHYGLRPQPFYLGVGFVALGLLLSALAVRETKHHAAAESKLQGDLPPEGMPTQQDVFWRTTLLDKDLSTVSQAGLVNNLNDGMAWGLFPLFFAAARMDLGQIGTLAAIYPATWGVAQLFTGAWSDRVGRKWLIATGMWVQAVGIAIVIVSGGFAGFAAGAALLGVGTAMVYPTLLAAIGDVAHPSWRASSVGVYRLWRDLGYAIGALLAGALADALGLPAAMWFIAALTFGSGLVVALRMRETLRGTPNPAGFQPAERRRGDASTASASPGVAAIVAKKASFERRTSRMQAGNRQIVACGRCNYGGDRRSHGARPTRREIMMRQTKHGFLILADISGFTAFVTATEIEHGPPLITELLEEVIRQISPPLEIQAIEGDAVFAVGADGNVLPPARLLEVLQAAFAGFREKQRELAADDSCGCNACRSVDRLRLKAIGHYGAFLELTVGGRAQVAGADVILAHRLLKNGVPRHGDYTILTRPALDYMHVDPESLGLVPHSETYDHFGDVECFVDVRLCAGPGV